MLVADLDFLKDFLEKETFPVEKEGASDAFPADHLIVNLGPDSQGREQKLYLTLVERDLQIEEGEEPQSETFLHFLVMLPFSFDEKHLGELCRFILMLNKSLELGSFGVSEFDKKIYFKQAMHFPTSRVKEILFLDIMGMIMMYLDAFSSDIEDVGLGNKTTLDFLRDTGVISE